MDIYQLATALFQEMHDFSERLDAGMQERILRQSIVQLPEDLVRLATEQGEAEELLLCIRNRLRNLLAFHTMTTQDYKHLTQRLTHAAYHFLRDWRLAEDAVQDTFLQMYRKRDNFRGDSSYYAWINKILFSRVMVMRKSPGFNSSPPPAPPAGRADGDALVRFLEDRPDNTPSQEEKTASKEKLFKVWQLISVLLTDKYSFPAFNLLFIQGYTYEEAAKVLDISVDHLYTRVSQARSKLLASKGIKALLEE